MAKTMNLKIFFVVILMTCCGTLWGSENKVVKIKAKLAGREISLEIADTPDLRSHGLMNRTQMAKNDGMLFVFDNEQVLTFWMKNTLLPLSIGFFNNGLKLVDIQEMKTEPMTVQEFPRYPSRKPARFALEMNTGWFAKNKIPLESKLTFISKDLPPSLKSASSSKSVEK